jgi:hypothetical protein
VVGRGGQGEGEDKRARELKAVGRRARIRRARRTRRIKK